MTDKQLHIEKDDFFSALRTGQLYLDLGPFRHQIQGNNPHFLEHLWEFYGACEAVISANPVVAQHIITVKPPSFLRRFVRPQVVGYPDFSSPLVPLPASMAPLAFEMAANLSVALNTYRFLILHASVVADAGGRCAIMSAQSGGGKSTLAAYLMAQGGRLLSDEFALVRGENALIHSYPRPVSLKNSSIDIVRELWPHVGPSYHETPKGRIAYARVRSDDLRNNEPAKPAVLLFPEYTKNVTFEAVKLAPEEAMFALVNSSPNYHVRGLNAFKEVQALATNIPAYRVHYNSFDRWDNFIADFLSLKWQP